MSTFFADFIKSYGMEILYAVFTAVAGYVGIVVKNLYQKHINDSTKKAVVKTCVRAIEQLYTDLHGQDKYDKVVNTVSKILADKGITFTDTELKMLIESTVGEFNDAFKNTTSD